MLTHSTHTTLISSPLLLLPPPRLPNPLYRRPIKFASEKKKGDKKAAKQKIYEAIII